MQRPRFALALALVVGLWAATGREARAQAPQLVSVTKIWDRAPHSAFTDLVRWRGKWFCVFREAEGHVGGDGKLRVLESADGQTWQPAALLEEKGIDLRDPHLS